MIDNILGHMNQWGNALFTFSAQVPIERPNRRTLRNTNTLYVNFKKNTEPVPNQDKWNSSSLVTSTRSV